MTIKVKHESKPFNDNIPEGHLGPLKTVPIRKRSMKKKRLCPRENFLQQQAKQRSHNGHVLNFYNMLSINEQAIKDPQHDESFVKSHFYHKNLKRIEVTEHYLIIQLADRSSNSLSIPQTIAAYRADPDSRFQTLGRLLDDIEHRAAINRPNYARTASLTAEAMTVLDSLGNAAYICRICSNRLVVSVSMMEMLGYNSQDFILECLKFRMPLFEGFSCHGYYEMIMKQLKNVILLMDYLDGRIPLATFNELNCHHYKEIIQSKHNIQFHCAMSISMPIPMVSLMRVEKILQTKEVLHYDHPMLHTREFKQYSLRIRQKELTTLQHLIQLPDNALPQNRSKVADYIERSVSDEQVSKSLHTHSA